MPPAEAPGVWHDTLWSGRGVGARAWNLPPSSTGLCIPCSAPPRSCCPGSGPPQDFLFGFWGWGLNVRGQERPGLDQAGCEKGLELKAEALGWTRLLPGMFVPLSIRVCPSAAENAPTASPYIKPRHLPWPQGPCLSFRQI